MLSEEDKVLQLMVNALIYTDESFSVLVRLKAVQIALDTAIDIQLSFASIHGIKLN